MDYLTTAEAAKALGVSVRRVRAIVQAGQLKAKKAGRDWLISKASLRAYKPQIKHRKKDTQ